MWIGEITCHLQSPAGIFGSFDLQLPRCISDAEPFFGNSVVANGSLPDHQIDGIGDVYVSTNQQANLLLFSAGGVKLENGLYSGKADVRKKGQGKGN